MAGKAVTNYVKYKDKIIELVMRGSLCYDCLARATCAQLCKTKGIDTSKATPPCKEAWTLWCESKK